MSARLEGENWTDDARAGTVRPGATQRELYDGGMEVRREVLGVPHVGRANANTDDFSARNGPTREEIEEGILQSTIYFGAVRQPGVQGGGETLAGIGGASSEEQR